ncbi:MAG: sugar phosphate isomerase/epimerase, partial [Deltaproteobacteria bacterium]|nr:sugar phosphate isomerase/epimerase [Deltaproteobacteria bacterium]
AFLERWANRIEHVHLSENTGKADQHLPLGVGTVPLEGIVRELKRTGYGGRFTVEVFSPDRDYLKLSLPKARNLWTRV